MPSGVRSYAYFCYLRFNIIFSTVRQLIFLIFSSIFFYGLEKKLLDFFSILQEFPYIFTNDYKGEPFYAVNVYAY